MRTSLGKNKQLRLFTLKFNPGELKYGPIDRLEEFRFNKDQRGLDYQPPKTIGEYMKSVNVHLLYIDRSAGKNAGLITVENRNLLESAKDRLSTFNQGVSINGGYFITPTVINDPLNKYIKPDLKGYPIGYFFSTTTPKYNGTFLPIPKSYQKDFVTVYVTPTGQINFMKSKEFRKQHEMVDGIVFYALNPTTKPPLNYAVKRRAIQMIKDPLRLYDVPMLKQNSDLYRSGGYNSAFETGPILIWDGKITFTREKMSKELFTIDKLDTPPTTDFSSYSPPHTITVVPPLFTPYRIVSSAKNFNMYFNEPGEHVFPYGQRHSNSLMVHNVMCETHSGELLFVFVEGRGFDSVGIDRAQLAELISKFNVKHAFSLDGGFSTGAVFKNPKGEKTGYYWLMNDPEKRELSTTIHIAVQ